MSKDESAVSESIGTIGMVAITVVLAAIILVFALTTSASTGEGYIVAASATIDSELEGYRYIHLAYHGGQSHEKLSYLNWTVSSPVASNSSSVILPEIGYTWDSPEIGPDNWNPPYRILVVATFYDGTQVVILDKWFEE